MLHILNNLITPIDLYKHKPIDVGRIALERQARQFNAATVAEINFL